MIKKLRALIASRRFWAAISTAIVSAVATFGFQLDPDVIQPIVLAIGAWIVGDSLRSTE